MKCLNCGNFINHGSICSHCGVDNYIYQKTRNSSIRLYNRGLKQANEMDLSGAILSLEQSVLFDKSNYQARNLLGLIYCEKGQLADALKHWIVSASVIPQENLAQEYINTLQKKARTMEKWNDAVHLYNEAIAYLGQGSEDLAVIQLKRALDYNKDFIEALNLMTLCCIQENNLERARYYIECVLKKDKKNPFALHYAELIDYSIGTKNAKHQKKKKKEKDVKITDSSEATIPYKKYDKRKSNLGKNEFFSFLLGAICTAIVLVVLVIPAIDEKKDGKIQELEKKVSANENAANISTEELNELYTQIDTLKKENETFKTQVELQSQLESLQTAEEFIEEKKYEEAAAIILSVDTSEFSEEEKTRYTTAKENTFSEAANSLYTKGKREYLNNNFDEAKRNLEDALKYAENENFIDDALFYLGKIAEENNDKAKAKEYYNRVLDEYPNSNQIANVKNILAQMEE